MNPEKETPENQIEEFALDGKGAPSSSLDDFLKELEAKEKDLQMSSDLVVQIDENDISEQDTLELLKFFDNCKEKGNGKNSSKNGGELPAKGFARNPLFNDHTQF